MKTSKKLSLITILCLVFTYLFAQAQTRQSNIDVSYSDNNKKISNNNTKTQWVDSVYNSLNESERIGQLFMVAAYSGGKEYNEEKIKSLINAHQIGGLIFMQGTPESQVTQNNQFQSMAQVPLLIGMDAEWGLGMRLNGVSDFPREMMVGATRDTAMAYELGKAIAAQCKRMGVHINFGPVVDVNNNPNNPIINARSFGEDKTWVAKLGIAYMRGLQNNGVIASAKHFPGHGDTDKDSHKDLPVVNKTLAQLEAEEFYPFKEMIKAGIKSMMVAHLQIPALESAPNTPTTLSKNTITGLLKNQMGFNGLIFTDALNMQGVAKYYAPGEVDLKAFMAGNDILLFSQDVPTAIAKIQGAIAEGKVTTADLEQRVKKVLAAKYDAGLANWKPVDPVNVREDVNKDIAAVRAAIAQKAVTLVRDKNNILNQFRLEDKKVNYIGVNAYGNTPLYNKLKDELNISKVEWLSGSSTDSQFTSIADSMNNGDITIVAVHNMNLYPLSSGNYGLDAKQMDFLKKVQSNPNVMVVVMGNPYILKNIPDVASAMVAYEDDDITQTAVANVLLRNEEAMGVLPVTPAPGMKQEIRTVAQNMSKTFGLAQLKKVDFVEDAGVVNKVALDKLSMFIHRSIAQGAFPGAQVFAAKNGKILYEESFGYTTFGKTERVTNNTIYDVASVTKVMSTTLAIMKLYETKKLDLNKTIGDYLPWTKGTNKSNLVVRDLLMHQAGMVAWIPFYKETVDAKGNLKEEYYSKTPSPKFNHEVAKGVYLRSDYTDTVWKRILESPLENKGKYVYSDLDYFFLSAIAEQITGQSISKYVDEQFYKPLGLKRTTYTPLKKFNETEIAPTENDQYFRHQQLRGYVHDQAAALFGGVAGHAGVFSTAKEVGTVFEMLLSGGTYNGKRFFTKETVDMFTGYRSSISRRALGFDKPSPSSEDGGPACNRVSGLAFGHQGFTGTCAWADPATGVVYVFLSNRVSPSAENNTINKLSVRTVVQDYIYESLGIPVNRTRSQVQREQLASAQ